MPKDEDEGDAGDGDAGDDEGDDDGDDDDGGNACADSGSGGGAGGMTRPSSEASERRISSKLVGRNRSRELVSTQQGLTLVQLTAQTEPFLSLKSPNVSRKQCSR